MSQLVSISDYYLQDVPEGTLFLPSYPSSSTEDKLPPGQIANRSKWNFHQKADIINNLHSSDNQNKISFLGKGLKALVYDRPHKILLQHWGEKYGQEFIPDFVPWGTQGYTIAICPTEALPPHLHSVDPDVHYKIHSKKFIGEIDVSQAKILNGFQSPCVVKATHGFHGNLVWFVNTQDEFNRVLQNLFNEIPNSDYVICEKIEGVKITYNVNFYITKSGEVQWISASEQYLKGQRSHGKIESVIKIQEQEYLKMLLYPLCKAVGDALHKVGYFGYCGVDLVVDEFNKPYVVDINPRINGSSTLQLSTLHLHQKKGFTVGVHRRGVVVKEPSLEKVMEKVDGISNGMAVVLSATPQEGEMFACGVSVYSHSEEMCYDIFQQLEE